MNLTKVGYNNQTEPTVGVPGTTTTEPPKTVQFGAEKEDEVVLSTKPKKEKSLTAKKWGVGIASYVCTGLGQLINGQVGKAFGLWGIGGGFGLLAGIGLSSLTKDSSTITFEKVSDNYVNIKNPFNLSKLSRILIKENPNKKSMVLPATLAIIGLVGALGAKIYSIVNAVKNVKPNQK